MWGGTFAARWLSEVEIRKDMTAAMACFGRWGHVWLSGKPQNPPPPWASSGQHMDLVWGGLLTVAAPLHTICVSHGSLSSLVPSSACMFSIHTDPYWGGAVSEPVICFRTSKSPSYFTFCTYLPQFYSWLTIFGNIKTETFSELILLNKKNQNILPANTVSKWKNLLKRQLWWLLRFKGPTWNI